MSDQEIVFGTPEHIAGLSRKALEEDFRWVQDRCTELEVECERMASENAKLRGERDRMYKANVEKNGEILRLLEENAKLRELVRDMYFCNDETCTDCEYHDYSGEGFWCKRGVRWKKVRMRELGVELDA